MTTKTIKAGEVEAGMKVHFPNSRRAQEVETIETRPGLGNNVERKVFHSGDAQWDCPADYDVKVEEEAPSDAE